MKREIDDKTILDKFAEDFTKIIERCCKYIVVSGFVAIAHGRSRGTEDIDIIIERISPEKFSELHNALIKGGFQCIQSDNPEVIYQEYLSKKDSVRYVRKSEGYFPPEAELKLAKDSLDEEQLKTRTKLPLTGLEVYFSSIEMNIAFKEELLKSDKDLGDARHLRIIYKEQIDDNRIEEIKKKIKELRLGDGKR
jgi:nitrogen regulatory protein PII